MKRFIDECEQLKKLYANDTKKQDNGSVLLGLGVLPKAKHILFAPLREEKIILLTNSYKELFPDELIEFYRYSNGAELFYTRTVINLKKKIQFASSSLVLFGFPQLPISLRDVDHWEPSDIRIEDLDHHGFESTYYLKCAYFCNHTGDPDRFEIYINTKTHKTVMCNASNPILEWSNLEDCLLYLLDKCKLLKSEYFR